MNKEQVDLLIIGGGPAGLAAAVAAYDNGIQNMLILERDRHTGGILQQCIHNGFGLHRFGRELTGPEYAWEYEKMAEERKLPIRCSTMVLDVSPDKTVTAVSAQGIVQIEAKSVILAMGCRERSRGALNIPGSRPAGIFFGWYGAEIRQLHGISAGTRGCHSRFWRYRADYGAPHDVRGCEGESGVRTNAVLWRPCAEHSAMLEGF